MSDGPLDSIPAFDRVSIRAVLVQEGGDAGADLAEAGIFDPVIIPVVFDATGTPPGQLIGNGITPNLTGVLEPDWQPDSDASQVAEPDQPPNQPPTSGAAAPAAVTLPEAFGLQPLAPVGRTAPRS